MIILTVLAGKNTFCSQIQLKKHCSCSCYLKKKISSFFVFRRNAILSIFNLLLFVCRPGLIGAHSKTGHPNLNDWLFLLVNGMNSLGSYPTSGQWDYGHTDIIPVDTVASAIVKVSLEEKLGKYVSLNDIYLCCL